MLRTCVITQFVFILLLNLGALNVHQGFAIGCHEAEREALLKFKHSLSDPTNTLSSWEGKGCCDWEGVSCDNVTAFVTRLDLHNPFYEPFGASDSPDSPQLDPSLLGLSHLNYLDLSSIDFLGSQIPKFIGAFKHLRYLNLSYSGFSDIVPSQLSNLTRLQTLDLNSNKLLSSDLHWVSKLVSLQYLDFGGNYILHSNNSMDALNMPPSLRALHLNGCQNLVNKPLLLSSLFSNSTCLSRIQHLDISGNALGGRLPYFLANMTSLRHLAASWNSFTDSFPMWLRTMTSLTHLDLLANTLNGSIPLWFGNMTSLTYLDLSRNKLNGSIPLSMRNMRKLEYLDLRSNRFSSVEGGAIMGILGNLCKLINFDLSHNSIGGSIVASHNNISKCVSYDLENLRLDQNMIGGMLPPWLGDFKHLRELDISYNRINGPVPVSIGRLSYLEYLDLSFNTLNGTLPQGLGQCKSLVHIDLSHNNLTGALPQGLGQCKSLVHIDLSSNFLHGALSESHFDTLSKLEYLDLHMRSKLSSHGGLVTRPNYVH